MVTKYHPPAFGQSGPRLPSYIIEPANYTVNDLENDRRKEYLEGYREGTINAAGYAIKGGDSRPTSECLSSLGRGAIEFLDRFLPETPQPKPPIKRKITPEQQQAEERKLSVRQGQYNFLTHNIIDLVNKSSSSGNLSKKEQEDLKSYTKELLRDKFEDSIEEFNKDFHRITRKNKFYKTINEITDPIPTTTDRSSPRETIPPPRNTKLSKDDAINLISTIIIKDIDEIKEGNFVYKGLSGTNFELIENTFDYKGEECTFSVLKYNKLEYYFRKNEDDPVDSLLQKKLVNLK